MQLGLNKHLQPHEIKSYKHKIKNKTNKNRNSVPYTKCIMLYIVARTQALRLPRRRTASSRERSEADAKPHQALSPPPSS